MSVPRQSCSAVRFRSDRPRAESTASNLPGESDSAMSEVTRPPSSPANLQSWWPRTLAAALILSLASTIIGCTMVIPPRGTMAGSETGTGSQALVGEPILVHVLRVLSGDTIEVDLNGQSVLVRYLFTDSPDPGAELYNEATKLNQLLVGNADVLLVAEETDRDADGRLLRYVLTGDGLLVNEQMIAEGMARYEPKSDTSLHHAAMVKAETTAMELGIGVWR